MGWMKDKRRREREAKQPRDAEWWYESEVVIENEQIGKGKQSREPSTEWPYDFGAVQEYGNEFTIGLDQTEPYEPIGGSAEIIVGFEKSSHLTPTISKSGNVSFGHAKVDHILEKYNVVDFRKMLHPGKFVLISKQPNAEKVVSELRNIKPLIRLAVPDMMMYLDGSETTRDRGPGICCLPYGLGYTDGFDNQATCESYADYSSTDGSIWMGYIADGATGDDCKGACCTFITPLGENYSYPDGGSCDLDPIFNCTCQDNVYWGSCDPQPGHNDKIFAGFGTTCASDACEDPDTFAWSRSTADSWVVEYDYSSDTWIQQRSGNFRSPLHLFPSLPRVPHADLQFNLQNMGYPEAWDYEPESENVVVAVIDTGVGGFESSVPEWHRHECWDEKVNSGIIEKHETVDSSSGTSGITTDIDRIGLSSNMYHGSACISVIGARNYNDDWGHKGVCPHCKMVSIRNSDWHCLSYNVSPPYIDYNECANHTGFPDDCDSDVAHQCYSFEGAQSSASANAIQYIAEHYGRDSGYDGCIINMSFGTTWQGMAGIRADVICPNPYYDSQCGAFGDTCGPTGIEYDCEPDPYGFHDEINYAIEQGCILVASAGNKKKNLKPYTDQHPDAWHHSPSGYPGVIEVAATSYAPYYQSVLHNRKSHYSNYGETINIAATVDYYMANNFYTVHDAYGNSLLSVDSSCNNTLDCQFGLACVDMDADDLSGHEISPWIGADSFCESGGASCTYDYDSDQWSGCCCRPYKNEYGIDHGFSGHDDFVNTHWTAPQVGKSRMLAITPSGFHGGTSAAAPVIAGILGYMKSLSPGYDNNDEIINTLYGTATNIDSTNTTDPYGSGYMQIGPDMLGEGLANAHDALHYISSGGAAIDYDADWNLVSLPLNVEDNGYLTIFPTAVIGTLYEFNGTYVNESDLDPGKGYWLRFDSGGSQLIAGEPISELTISLSEGWNIIGGISTTVHINNVIDLDNIIVPGTLYEFNGTYVPSLVLEPGKGYWIKANADGEIILNPPPETYEYQVKIIVQSDHYPNETTWEMCEPSGEVCWNGGPYGDPNQDSVYIEEIVEVVEGQGYLWTIYDSYGDGICCHEIYGSGYYWVQLSCDDGETWTDINYGGVGPYAATNIGPDGDFYDQVDIGFDVNPSMCPDAQWTHCADEGYLSDDNICQPVDGNTLMRYGKQGFGWKYRQSSDPLWCTHWTDTTGSAGAPWWTGFQSLNIGGAPMGNDPAPGYVKTCEVVTSTG